MLDPELLERITARRAELDELAGVPAKQLAAVLTERDELAVAHVGRRGGVSMSFVKDVVPGMRVFGVVMRRE
ncbi:hypothetical protein ACWEPM_34135 [Streptomyces sp. NPDC004244]